MKTLMNRTNEELQAELQKLYARKDFHKVEVRAEIILDLLRERRAHQQEATK